MRKIPNYVTTNHGIGTTLRLIRLSRGLTQQEMAKRLNVSASYLGRLERGTTTLDKQPTYTSMLLAKV
jgi:transcriptional regulator with XRE-family HTH domain